LVCGIQSKSEEGARCESDAQFRACNVRYPLETSLYVFLMHPRFSFLFYCGSGLRFVHCIQRRTDFPIVGWCAVFSSRQTGGMLRLGVTELHRFLMCRLGRKFGTFYPYIYQTLPPLQSRSPALYIIVSTSTELMPKFYNLASSKTKPRRKLGTFTSEASDLVPMGSS
jgi:hypothetical protein